MEFFAVRNPKPGASLSSHAWTWGSLKEKARAWRWRRLVFLVLLVWLAAHILSGGFF